MNVNNNYTSTNKRSKFYYLFRFRFLGHLEIVCFDCNSKVKWRHPFMTRKLAWWLLDRKCNRNDNKLWKQNLKEPK